EGNRTAVPGVSFTVTAADGSEVGTGVSDIEGVVLVEVPGAGDYTLTIDPATLPEGIGLADDAAISRTVSVSEGGTANAIFALSDGSDGGAALTGDSGITFRRVSQLTVDGVKLGLFLGMAAIGLSLIFGTTGLVNFAHSEMIAFGYLAAYFFNFYGLAGVFGFMAEWPWVLGGGVNLIIATIIAVILGAGFGWLLDWVIFAPLRRRGVSLIAQLVVTIGLSVFLRYGFLLIFEGTQRFYRDFTAQRGRTYLGLVDLTDKDLLTMIVSILVLVLVGLVLAKTRIGKAMRAVSDNRDLAESSGINVERVIRMVWVAGGGLAALGGVFLALSETVNWLLGFRMLLLIFAGVTLGGLGTTYGALVGCLLVGMGIQLSTLFIPIELKNAGALAVLIGILLFRPQGILGRAERIG
ncbi:MAG: branched-chain amino acid ABC transporter permease, partial [Acidimicrobiia bacterium]|nr:branched-chain amino acid ABC transporter permease [Acidimicrobiia bacterium]